ncbi:MAG TPA: GNAT family N-acetyltransferase [Gemmatimonadota bacterium]|jgi:GNAT superfamily N-acetyltransferase|nr:GNAT family N-acetyltransferase [Gemmatimonadota bacterium]
MTIEVELFRDDLGTHFEKLNREWIERHFEVEPRDREVLGNPRREIVDRGGEVFFLLDGDLVLGTCAMIPQGEDVYELSKMAVDPASRGHGLGDRLMEAAIAWARGRGARRIVLESNTILVPAIELYRKHGFRTTRLGPGDEYERSNIEMTLDLTP